MGRKLKCIIVKYRECGRDKEHKDVVVESKISTHHGEYGEHEVKFDLPYEQAANALEDFVSNSELTFSPAADFTEISQAGNGEWSVGSDKTKLTVNLQKMNCLMLEAKKDVGYVSLPANFSVTVKDKQGDIFTDEHASIDLSDTAKILKSIDEQCLQQGSGYLAELFYELIAQGKV